jgi:tetratricopeptide (TPR) repeat protein
MAEDTMLTEAIEALRKGDHARAKDLLTRLLKLDQSNATYWVWLSAAVETQKERIYCLQTALKLDPNNAAAKRGLVLFGVLKPDENIKPFPMNHVRPWEESLKKSEEDKPRGLKAAWGNPVTRLMILGTLVLMVTAVWAGFNAPSAVYRRPTRTPGPSPTYTLTPTALNAKPQVVGTSAFIGPTPLWMLLQATYTPTPLYVVTQHPITSSDAYNAGIRYFEQGNWQDAITLMKQVAAFEVGSAADAWYYIGEAYRLSGNNVESKKAFDQAINIDPNFGVAYLGRAIVTQALDPEANVKPDLDKAIELDPTYAPAYVERAAYYIVKKETEAARADVDKALELDAGSSGAYYVLAQIELHLGNNAEALTAAQKANELDVTSLPVYLVLGQAYQKNGQFKEAVRALIIYNLYHPGDSNAMLFLATGYNTAGDYQEAINLLDEVIVKDKKRAEAYYQRGLAYLGLEEFKKASTDFKSAAGYDPNDFDAYIGLARAYIKLDFPGDAYLQIKDHAAKLAQSDGQKAQVYYWEATALEALENASAVTFWQNLLDLSEDVMPAEWRTLAQERIAARVTGTPTSALTVTPTPTPTRTPTPTKTTIPTKIP